MGYCTTTSIALRMIGTTFDSATTSLCTELISDADAEINKYLSKRYDVSAFTSTSLPPIIETWAKRLTTGYMYQEMARGGKDGLAHGQSLIDPVLKNLEMIADRKADLIGSDGTPVEESANGSFELKSSTTNYTPTFNEDEPISWATDQDKLDDIEDGRDA